MSNCTKKSLIHLLYTQEKNMGYGQLIRTFSPSKPQRARVACSRTASSTS